MAKFIDLLDFIYAISAVIIIIVATIAERSGLIHQNAWAAIILLLISIIAIKAGLPHILNLLLQKKVFGKGLHDYWNEARNQMMQSSQKYDFSYPIPLPETYFPSNIIQSPQLDIVFFEINADDFKRYVGEKTEYANPLYKIHTILFRPSSSVIFGVLRNTSLRQAVEYVNENKESFIGMQPALIIQPPTLPTPAPIPARIITQPETRVVQ